MTISIDRGTMRKNASFYNNRQILYEFPNASTKSATPWSRSTKGGIDLKMIVREDKHTLRDLVLLAVAFRMISYEFGKELLRDLEEFTLSWEKRVEKSGSD